MPNVVGVDIPWNAPRAPDLIFDLADGLTPDQMVDVLSNTLNTART